MPEYIGTHSYGTAQIKEVKLGRGDLVRLALQNIQQRTGEHYNFDLKRPWIQWDEDSGDLVLRFATTDITTNTEARHLGFKSFESMKLDAEESGKQKASKEKQK